MPTVKPQSAMPEDDVPGTTAVEPPTPEPKEGKPKDPTQVRYVGPATDRRITKQDWERAGVKDQEQLMLGRGEAMDLERLSPEAITVLRRDANFKFE